VARAFGPVRADDTREAPRARAIGLWQFIAETGWRYGLRVTPYVDDRYDPVKSTDAALTYRSRTTPCARRAARHST